MKTNEKAITGLPEVKRAMSGALDVIYSRRAMRKYKEMPVDRNLIEQVIDAGRMAPSAMNRQPWKFHVMTDPILINKFSKQIGKAAIKGIAKMNIKEIGRSIISAMLHPLDLSFFKDDDFVFHGAPVVIFISASKENEWAALDTGACAQNMMLAAKAIGLDSCPIGFAKFVEGTELYSMLKLPKNDRVLLAVILGYGNDAPEVHERKKDNLFFID